MSNSIINVAADFYPRPAGRYDSDGKNNGARFRKEKLVPLLKDLGDGDHLIINFNGVTMAGSSFLEEAFGGLIREEKFDKKHLLSSIEIISNRPIIKTRIMTYINEAT